MATHRSAEKRHRQSLKRRTRNREAKSAIKAEVKKVLDKTETGSVAEAKTELKSAARKLDKAVSRGIIHKKKAARKISRLAKAVNKSAAGKA